MDEAQVTSMMLFIERCITRRPLTDEQKNALKHFVAGGEVQVVETLNQPTQIILR